MKTRKTPAPKPTTTPTAGEEEPWRVAARWLERHHPAEFGDPAAKIRRLRRQIRKLRAELAARTAAPA